MTPEVTLTMAAWCANPPWLLDAVRSALADDGCSLELVVVDDGSPEPVAHVLADIDDSRLRVVRIEHGGTAAARNAGVAHARGRLIRFLDADDVVAPGSTARLARIVGGTDDVIAYGATAVCDAELRPQRMIESTFEGDLVERCLLGHFDVRHVSMLFPRRVVERAGPWVGGFHASEDWDFVLRALEHASVLRDPAVATLYRRHERSRTRAANVAAGEIDRRRVVERYFERHPELRASPLARSARAATELATAAGYASAGERRLAAARLARAARIAPVQSTALAARLLVRGLRGRLTGRSPGAAA